MLTSDKPQSQLQARVTLMQRGTSGQVTIERDLRLYSTTGTAYYLMYTHSYSIVIIIRISYTPASQLSSLHVIHSLLGRSITTCPVDLKTLVRAPICHLRIVLERTLYPWLAC